MDTESRKELHQRLSAGMIDALTRSVERQKVELPDEFVLSENATVWAPMVYGPEAHTYKDAMGATGQTPSERTTLEFRNYWTVMPDFRLAEHGDPLITEHGFSVWFRFEGTTADDRTLGFYEVDFVYTDDRGEISRMETFHDLPGLSEVLALFGSQPSDGWEALRGLRARAQGHP